MKIAISIILTITIAFSQDYAGNFLHIEQGAKTTASGNAFFTNNNDISAFRYFPADYSFGTAKKVYSIYSSRYSGLYNQYHLGYSQPLFGGYNFTFNWNYSGVSDIPRYNDLIIDDSTGLPQQKSPNGFFSNNNNIASITFGKVFDNLLDLGWDYFIIPIRFPSALTINYVSTSIDNYNAYALTFDLSSGITFNLGELFVQNKGVGNLTFYYSYMNIAGTDLIWDKVSSFNNTTSTAVQSNEFLPVNAIYGINLEFPDEELLLDVGLAIQYQTLYSQTNFGLLFDYDNFLEFRFGLSDGRFTTGFGVKAYNSEIFLSFQPKHALGSTFLMDLSYDIE